MLLDVRAKEISELRRRARALGQTLAEAEANARANDRILRALHKLSLLLIAKPATWQRQTVALLKKEFQMPFCELRLFGAADAELAKAVRRLPSGGQATSAPLASSKPYAGAKRYFYLPLKKGRDTAGVLIFASRKADAFPDDAARDFSRRLAELLGAAL